MGYRWANKMEFRAESKVIRQGYVMTKNRDIKELVENWVEPPVPTQTVLEGRFARLEPLFAATHASALHAANTASEAIWNHMSYGPFKTEAAYRDWIAGTAVGHDPFFYAISDKATGQWCGVASYLRIAPAAGSIEVGHVNFAPALQKTPAATEAMFLMMKWAFDAGYRRYEWKCDAANVGSRRAAQRYGFSYEGIFRKAGIVKGHNRDTAWFAMIDDEWPALKVAFETWLSPDNFDTDGQQRQRLANLTAPVRVASDPGLA